MMSTTEVTVKPASMLFSPLWRVCSGPISYACNVGNLDQVQVFILYQSGMDVINRKHVLLTIVNRLTHSLLHFSISNMSTFFVIFELC